ncbi:hypothetical protein EVAR_5615_1 [Eumeta japonica]|uniref:Uncharacterized protein n=1 Tax=Eumeta variegata TaxID=151549 RepID=A0A4C1T720_EUMVA|nr:hypothetical protein EVAR_5615_1 [Eumeta japonica]
MIGEEGGVSHRNSHLLHEIRQWNLLLLTRISYRGRKPVSGGGVGVVPGAPVSGVTGVGGVPGGLNPGVPASPSPAPAAPSPAPPQPAPPQSAPSATLEDHTTQPMVSTPLYE